MIFFKFSSVWSKIQLEIVMDAVVAGVVNKVMEEVNKMQVTEFNEGLVKDYLCKVNKIKLEVVIDVVVELVDEEVTKVAEQVNKELVKEVNEGFVLVDVVMVVEVIIKR